LSGLWLQDIKRREESLKNGETLFSLFVSCVQVMSRVNSSVVISVCLVLFIQLECQWRTRTGLHSSQSSTMTLPMRYPPTCRSCNTWRSQAGLVRTVGCWYSVFFCQHCSMRLCLCLEVEFGNCNIIVGCKHVHFKGGFHIHARILFCMPVHADLVGLSLSMIAAL
jgi:hypothetical protein